MRQLSPDLYVERGRFLRSVRSFFEKEGFLEVETPILHATGTPEPFIENLTATDPTGGHPAYLITSPEYYLKTVLAEVRRPVFQIAHVFRAGDGEHGSPLHTTEFLMLEWYVPGFDEFALMQQITELLRFLNSGFSTTSLSANIPIHSMADLLHQYAGCTMDASSLKETAMRLRLATSEEIENDRFDELFFRVFLHCVEPELAKLPYPLFVHGYPPSLAAYSVIDGEIARRFELYWKGIELANGYYELTDCLEQKKRFDSDNAIRRSINRTPREPDQQFLAALERGMPPAAGVALGLDRLFMIFLGAERIEEISPFK